MKKRLLIFFLCAISFLALFEFYILYLYPQDISLGGYFSSILQSLVGGESNKLIRINLYNYAIVLYEDGNFIKQARISGMGNPKFSPTPQGSFKILSKEVRHISGINGVIMPLSLRFYRGYYLHGLPFTRSGQPVNTVYSLGCVRLGPGLDEDVYNWAEIGTKVEIYKARLVKSAEEPAVFLLTEEGFKEWIPNPETFNNRGFFWKDIAIVPLAEINNYPEVSATKL
ncbi:L,D-transpeptidase [Patescibacteria group bacterium]|nr:L,D-transpeptidase [Patescibacteria group bacterium]